MEWIARVLAAGGVVGCTDRAVVAVDPTYEMYGSEPSHAAGMHLTSARVGEQGAHALLVAAPSPNPAVVANWEDRDYPTIHALEARHMQDGLLRDVGWRNNANGHGAGACLEAIPDVDGDGVDDVGVCASRVGGIFPANRDTLFENDEHALWLVPEDYWEEGHPVRSVTSISERYLLVFDGGISVRDRWDGGPELGRDDDGVVNVVMPDLYVGEHGSFALDAVSGLMVASIRQGTAYGLRLFTMDPDSGSVSTVFEWLDPSATRPPRVYLRAVDEGLALIAIGREGLSIWNSVGSTSTDIPDREIDLLDGRALDTGDIDGDGFADLLVTHSEQVDVFLHPWGRRASFSFTAAVPSGVFGGAVHVTDLDGDGSTEVYVGSPFAGDVLGGEGVVQVFLDLPL